MDARGRAAQKIRAAGARNASGGARGFGGSVRPADPCMGGRCASCTRGTTSLRHSHESRHGSATRLPHATATGSMSAPRTVAGRDGASHAGRRHQEGRDGGGVVEPRAPLRKRPKHPVQLGAFDAQRPGVAGVQLHRHQPLRRPPRTATRGTAPEGPSVELTSASGYVICRGGTNPCAAPARHHFQSHS